MKKIIIATACIVFASVAGYFIGTTFFDNGTPLNIEKALAEMPEGFKSSYTEIDNSFSDGGVRVKDLVINSKKTSIKFSSIYFYNARENEGDSTFDKIEAKGVSIIYKASDKQDSFRLKYEIPSFVINDISIKDGLLLSYLDSLDAYSKISNTERDIDISDIFEVIEEIYTKLANGISADSIKYSNVKTEFNFANNNVACEIDGDVSIDNWNDGKIYEKKVGKWGCHLVESNGQVTELEGSGVIAKGINLVNYAKLFNSKEDDIKHLDIFSLLKIKDLSIYPPKSKNSPDLLKLDDFTIEGLKIKNVIRKIANITRQKKTPELEKKLLELVLDLFTAKKFSFSNLNLTSKGEPISIKISEYQIDDMNGFLGMGKFLLYNFEVRGKGEDFKLGQLSIRDFDLSNIIIKVLHANFDKLELEDISSIDLSGIKFTDVLSSLEMKDLYVNGKKEGINFGLSSFTINDLKIKDAIDKLIYLTRSRALLPLQLKDKPKTLHDLKLREIKKKSMKIGLDLVHAKEIAFSGFNLSRDHRLKSFSFSIDKIQADNMEGLAAFDNFLISGLNGKVIGSDFKLDKFNIRKLNFNNIIHVLNRFYFKNIFIDRKSLNDNMGNFIKEFYKTPIFEVIEISGLLIPTPIGKFSLDNRPDS